VVIDASRLGVVLRFLQETTRRTAARDAARALAKRAQSVHYGYVLKVRRRGAAIVLALLAAACSGSSHKSSATSSGAPTSTTPTARSNPSTSPTTSQPTTTSEKTSTSTAQGASCRTANLSVSLGPPNGAAGTIYYEIAFRNDSASTCVLYGYPGVSFLDRSNEQIGAPVQRNTQPHTTVSLAPGATAYAALGVTDPDIPPCPAATPKTVRIFPPNETVPALVAATAGMTVCAAKLSPGFVGPVVNHATS
jgi:hypothetical protein